MSALVDWLQSVTVHENMPDLEAEIPCDDSGCSRVATERSLVACSGCGRISDVICHAHGNGLRRAMAENRKLEHRPCGWRSCAVLAVVPL